MSDPFGCIAAELARFAVNVDLVAESINSQPEPLSDREAVRLTIPVAHLRLALERLEDALHQTDRLSAT